MSERLEEIKNKDYQIMVGNNREPELISDWRYLIQEAEQRKEAEWSLSIATESVVERDEKIAFLTEKIERYEEALKFYADHRNYLPRANGPIFIGNEHVGYGEVGPPIIDDDAGVKANLALEDESK